jgi:hypothetical protein
VLNQLEHREARLGNGDASIARSGCFLTTLTMASNRLTGANRDVVQANQAVLDNGGFNGSNLVVPKAANALGVRVVSRSVATRENVEAAEHALDRGKLAFAGVDYKDGKSSGVSAADHFLLITGRGQDTLTAIDPAGGREITFTKRPDGSYAAGKYRIAEIGILDREADAPRLPGRRILA